MGMGIPTLILSQTASDSASISFTSDIDSTYDEYMFVFTDIAPADNNASLNFQVNAVGETGYNEAIQTTTFVARGAEDGSPAELAYDSGPSQSNGTSFQLIITSIGNGADESGAGILYLFTPSDTTYVKHFYSNTSSYQHADAEYNLYVGGYINTTTAIDDIQFKMGSGNFDGVIQMYGIE